MNYGAYFIKIESHQHKRGDLKMERWRYIILSLAAVLMVTGVILMLDGHALGDRTAGIATVIGLTGMFLFIIFNTGALLRKKIVK